MTLCSARTFCIFYEVSKDDGRWRCWCVDLFKKKFKVKFLYTNKIRTLDLIKHSSYLIKLIKLPKTLHLKFKIWPHQTYLFVKFINELLINALNNAETEFHQFVITISLSGFSANYSLGKAIIWSVTDPGEGDLGGLAPLFPKII